jgi:hypothetical protein
MVWSTFQTVMNDDRVGLNKVEQKRAVAERQQKESAAKEVAEKQAREAEKQAREQAAAEAEVILERIHQLSVSNDLSATYNEITSLGDRISQLPPDIKSNLLDALQIAVLPIDERRKKLLSDLQHALLEIQALPDGEEKLRRLGALATSVNAVPGIDASTLAGAVETMRDATRARMSKSANAPNADSIAEGESLKAATEEERARQHAAEEAAAVAKAQRDKSKASADEAIQNLAAIIPIFSIAKVCAENHIVYDDNKIDILKERTRKYIESNNIPKEQVDRIWNITQEFLATKSIRESDCVALGSNISAVFGANVFEGTGEKNPF